MNKKHLAHELKKIGITTAIVFATIYTMRKQYKGRKDNEHGLIFKLIDGTSGRWDFIRDKLNLTKAEA